MPAGESSVSEQYVLPDNSATLWSDLYYYLLRKPEIETLIGFETPVEREDFSKRVLQRLGMGTDQFAVLNIHKIGINVPGRYVFEELLTWDNDSEYWPNHLACIKRREGMLDHVRIFLLGRENIFSFKHFKYHGIVLPPLFVLNKIHFNLTPNTSDVDNARSLLYDCSGGYPIGIFSMYVRSSIAEHKETETSQLFFMVAFNFFGKQNWFNSHVINPVWEIIHDRATANIMNRIKQICEFKFNDFSMQ